MCARVGGVRVGVDVEGGVNFLGLVLDRCGCLVLCWCGRGLLCVDIGSLVGAASGVGVGFSFVCAGLGLGVVLGLVPVSVWCGVINSFVFVVSSGTSNLRCPAWVWLFNSTIDPPPPTLFCCAYCSLPPPPPPPQVTTDVPPLLVVLRLGCRVAVYLVYS